MVEGGQDLGFALEARHARGIAGKGFGQNFERDVAFQPGVFGSIYFPHAARADGRQNLVGAKAGTSRERHWV